jgi:hypothetical protein
MLLRSPTVILHRTISHLHKDATMLYQIYETQRSLMEPFTDLAQFSAKAYANPLSILARTRLPSGYRQPSTSCIGWAKIMKSRNSGFAPSMPMASISRSMNALKSASPSVSCGDSNGSVTTRQHWPN